MKEELLRLLDMDSILNKYGIKKIKYMCHCPFHKDSSPSMKIYDKSFYCFSCNRTGDFIEFVKQYFNLNFQEAMEKINIDFNLGLQTRGRVDRKRLKEIEKEMRIKKEKEEKVKKDKNNKYIQAAKRYIIYNNILKNMQKQINKDNWEEIVEVTAFLQDKLELLEWYMEDLYK